MGREGDVSLGQDLLHIELAHPHQRVREAAGQAHHLLSRFIGGLRTEYGVEKAPEPHPAGPATWDEMASALEDLARIAREVTFPHSHNWINAWTALTARRRRWIDVLPSHR